MEVQGIRRLQDEFLLNNMRIQSSRLASYTSVDSTLYEVEAILGSVDNDHLGNAMNEFFAAWNTLATPPFSESNKYNVVAKAESLVRDFHAINDSLDDLEANIEDNIQLEISNLMGQKVYQEDLGHMPAGTHHVTLDATGLESGIYFYTIKIGNSTVTKRMIVN